MSSPAVYAAGGVPTQRTWDSLTEWHFFKGTLFVETIKLIKEEDAVF
jgi:hypothetical protein